MIIRRKHTANFTTIGNALFNDERLAADEVGILAFLLSRPNDWEVRRPALQRRWKIGREATKRIMTNMIRTGWCRAFKTRLPNGTFHVIYEIRDEPGPTLSEEEIRRALSLVSSEAASGPNPDENGADDAPDHPPPTDPPPTGQPLLADQRAASRMWPIEDSLNPESVNPDSESHRARISPEAFQLADQYRKAIGAEPDDVRWSGLPYQAQAWLNQDFDPLVILATAADIAGSYGEKPLSYHTKAIDQRCLAAKAYPQSPPDGVAHAKTEFRSGARRGKSHSALAVDWARRQAESSGSGG